MRDEIVAFVRIFDNPMNHIANTQAATSDYSEYPPPPSLADIARFPAGTRIVGARLHPGRAPAVSTLLRRAGAYYQDASLSSSFAGS